jgi:hypothetical protein
MGCQPPGPEGVQDLLADGDPGENFLLERVLLLAATTLTLPDPVATMASSVQRERR